MGEDLERFQESMVDAHPIGRVGTTEEMSKAILFLASEDSAWTTGSNLVVDGGRSLTMK